MRVDELIKHWQVAIDKGWVNADDELVVEWWSHEDVFAFIGGDDYYGDVTVEQAREVWGKVTTKLDGQDNIDNDLVRDTVSEVLDEWMEGK
jgi:hypothetical protein